MLRERAGSITTKPEAPKQPPPSKYFLPFFEAIETAPNEPIDCHFDTLVQIGESLLPHTKSRRPVDFDELIPLNAAVNYLSSEKYRSADATLRREGKTSVEMRIKRTDTWNGDGVHLWIGLKTKHDNLEIHSVKYPWASPTLLIIRTGRSNQRIKLKKQRRLLRNPLKPRWEKVTRPAVQP